jgi:hypothetical protein
VVDVGRYIDITKDLNTFTFHTMELCGVSYHTALGMTDDEILCGSPKPPATAMTGDYSLPLTPDCTYSPATGTRGIAYHGATPSPLFLNPMTDEDWSSRKLSSTLKLTLSHDDTRQLMEGVHIMLLRGEVRRPVTIKFDATNATLCILFQHDTDIGDEKKLDDFVTGNPLRVPVMSIARLTQANTSFAIKFKSSDYGIHELCFECSSLAQSDAIVDGLKAFIEVNNPLPRRRWLPQLKSSVLNQHEFSPLEGRFSPISLTEEPSRDEIGSPNQSPRRPCDSPARLRMHEAFNPCHKPLSTPAEQGMEVTLIDVTVVDRETSSNQIEIPLLNESYSTDSDATMTKPSYRTVESVDVVFPESLFESSFAISPLGAAPMTLNPWCANDICTITSVTEAFGELFGIGVMEPKNDAYFPECFNAGIASTDVPCFYSAFLPAEEMTTPIQSSGSDEYLRKRSLGNDTIRNRSDNITRQARYWQELKNDMTFEIVRRGVSHIQRTKSMDETDFTRAIVEPRQVSLLDSVFDHLYAPSSPSVMNQPDDEDLLYYYDSDPESTRERSFRGGSRQTERFETRHVPKFRLPRAIVRSRSLSDTDIKTVVDVMKSCTLHFLWHPNPTAEDPFPKPRCVQAWIERGTYLLNQNFVQPKFMWKPVHEAQLASRRKINLKVEKFDLLEIARIDCNPQYIDRSIYPLAHTPSCFVIKTKSSGYLFQACSVEEKIHVVFGLKLVVARLASLLICRDMAAVDEFFEPTDAAVPGNAPMWLS